MMVRARGCLAGFSCLILMVGCQDPADAPPAFTPVLLETSLWSGGELPLTAPWFAPPEPLPIIILGSDTLPLRRVDDTTIAARLPLATGVFLVRAIVGAHSLWLGDVTLHGFRDDVAGPYMSGLSYWLPGGTPSVVAGGDSGAVIVDLRLGTTRTIPDSIYSPDCAMSVGPTLRPERFVLEGMVGGVCGRPKLWAILPQPQLLDSSPIGGSSWYTMGQPADGRWIFNWNNHNEWANCESLPCTSISFLSADGPDGSTISPRGNRFLWQPQCCGAVTVYDAIDLVTAFTLPSFSHAEGSAFSFEGDTLALAVLDSAQQTHVVAVRETDGAVLRDLVVDSLSLAGVTRIFPGPIAFDPVRPWLYALIRLRVDTVDVPALLVVDRGTWTVVGVLPTPTNLAHPAFGSITIVPSPLEHLVYVVATVQGYNVHLTPGSILRFTTP